MGQIRAETARLSGLATVAKIYDKELGSSGQYTIAGTVEEIINSDEIDAICVCTPNHLNKQFTLAGLRAKKHVLCEKPPAFNSDDVLEIMTEEKKSGMKLMYGFNHRHH